MHSLGPQARVDIAEVKRLYGDRLCLIGNVNVWRSEGVYG